MKVFFIINPNAGKQNILDLLATYEDEFKKTQGYFAYVLTKNREDAILQTRIALKKGYEHLIALGGDGTLNAVVNGYFENGIAINSNAVIGVSDLGSGCDYYNAVAKGFDWKQLVQKFTAKEVDLGRIEFLKQSHEPMYFINMASVGLSAQVVKEKTFSYTFSALKALINFRPVFFTVVLDGKVIKEKFLNLFFAKGKTAGGGMKLGGKVAFDDGKFDITLVHKMPLWKSLFKFSKLFSSRFESDINFTKTTASTVEVYSPKRLAVEFDGEIFGTTDIKISLERKCIKIAFPSI